jgi:hypothetical protein
MMSHKFPPVTNLPYEADFAKEPGRGSSRRIISGARNVFFIVRAVSPVVKSLLSEIFLKKQCRQIKKGGALLMAKCNKFCHTLTFFDAAPPRSNPASRVFRYPHSFFRAPNP